MVKHVLGLTKGVAGWLAAKLLEIFLVFLAIVPGDTSILLIQVSVKKLIYLSRILGSWTLI